jgi:hypothetical protein
MPPDRESVAVVCQTISEAYAMDLKLNISNAPWATSDWYMLLLTGTPDSGRKYDRGYASIDLHPQVRSEHEDRWFAKNLGHIPITYVEL